jgi:hypothetical protein
LTNPSASPVTVTNLTLASTGNTGSIVEVTVWSNGVSIASGGFAGGSANIALSGIISGSSSVTYLFTSSFGAGASGTYVFDLSGAQGTNGQAVGFSGLAVNGATITVAPATATPTVTPNAPSTAKLVIYPNPSNGESVQVMPPAYSGTASVKIQIFTTAFRKVQQKIYSPQVYGLPLTLMPVDNQGSPLASGLYYVVVTVNNSRSIGKLLILR